MLSEEEKIKKKKRRQNSLKAINDRVGIYNVSVLSLSFSRLLSLPPLFLPLFLQKRQNQMLLLLPAAAAAS